MTCGEEIMQHGNDFDTAPFGPIVKTMSMQALADIALRSHRLLPTIRQHIEELSVIGSPAMKARGKKLLNRLARKNKG
jgi:hypothetical protein